MANGIQSTFAGPKDVEVSGIGEFEFHDCPVALTVEDTDEVITEFGIVAKGVMQFHE